ncbi:Neuronal PAS domain-containing protein 2 [Toxocara canis]|uniref:Neuronal PAS domain-containing protein 2 n=1 Tax=Toxocara canis TaxID=6265 RepID=A0A0B2URH5_TOXCA|nr:Neuronal PAS domain-containing protein 2 [Toxocara canis]
MTKWVNSARNKQTCCHGNSLSDAAIADQGHTFVIEKNLRFDLCTMMFPGGIGRDASSVEQIKKEAALKAKADLTAFILFGFAVEIETVTAADGDRKMDKSNVLKCAINFLKQKQLRAESTTEDVSCAVDAQLMHLTECTPREIARLYVEALNAGTFCVACTGRLYHVSSTFASFFSKSASEMRGMNVLELLEGESAKQLEQALSSEVFRAASVCTSTASPPPEAPLVRLTLTTRPLGKRILMLGRLKKVSVPNPLSSNQTYESLPKQEGTSEENIDTHNTEMNSNTALCLIGVARALYAAFESEISSEILNVLPRKSTAFVIVYNTRFTCIQLDHNCALMLGFGRLEMMGTSGYEYVHVDDLNALADSHRILMQRGVHQIEAHRLRTKAGQWLWVKCTATVQNENQTTRVACVYSLASPRSSSTHHPSRAFGQRIRSRTAATTRPVVRPPIASEPSQPDGDSVLPLSSVQPSSSQFSMEALRVSTTPLPIGTGSGTGMVCTPTCQLPSDCCSSVDLVNERQTPLTSPADVLTIGEAIGSNATTKSDPITNVLVEAYNAQSIKRKHASGCLDETMDSKSLVAVAGCTSPCSQASPLASPASVASLPKRRVHPLVYIEHFPLPDASASSAPAAAYPPASYATSLNPGSVVNPVPITDAAPSSATDSPLAISPMYRHVWEELQRKSDLLRQQVLQKELELQELHLKQFLSSLRGNKTV